MPDKATGHTPGPWHLGNEIHDHKSGSCWSVTVWSDNGPENGKIAAEGIAPTREMAQANARLISIAPDLLKALRDIQHNAAIMNQAEPNQVWSAIDDICRNAISKL